MVPRGTDALVKPKPKEWIIVDRWIIELQDFKEGGFSIRVKPKPEGWIIQGEWIIELRDFIKDRKQAEPPNGWIILNHPLHLCFPQGKRQSGSVEAVRPDVWFGQSLRKAAEHNLRTAKEALWHAEMSYFQTASRPGL